jgi:hypothetical protein
MLIKKNFTGGEQIIYAVILKKLNNHKFMIYFVVSFYIEGFKIWNERFSAAPPSMHSELQFSSFVRAYMYLKIFILYVMKSKIIHKNLSLKFSFSELWISWEFSVYPLLEISSQGS